MSRFEYTDTIDALDTSDNIETVWYNANSQELAVLFQSGVQVYGWKNFPASLWTEMVQEQAGVERGDYGRSLGRFVNQRVKGRFSGFSLGSEYGTDFVKVTQAGTITVTGSLNSATITASPAVSAVVQRTYVVRGTEPFEVSVTASSLEDAVAKVKNGNDKVKVTEVVVTFDV